MQKIELRPYQQNAVDLVTASYGKGHRKILIVLPTGAGKMVISASIILSALAKDKKILFISHRDEINGQLAAKLTALGVDFGFIQGGKRVNESAQVQIATYQTLSGKIRKHLKKADDAPEENESGIFDADLIFIDEAHLSCCKSYKQIVKFYDDKLIIGMTGSPIRLDGKGLKEVYTDMIAPITTAELIAAGYLVKPRTFVASKSVDLSQVKISKGDYDETELNEVMTQNFVVSNTVENWLTHSAGRKTIAFAVSVAHSKTLVENFNNAGVTAKHIDGTTPANLRKSIMDEWKAGEFTLLSNCNLYVEGLDVPEASTVLLCRPSKSLTYALQTIGRVMRPFEGKTDAIILDCAGISKEHGLVTSPHNWTLEGKDPRNKSKETKVDKHTTCKACFAYFNKMENPQFCPECGHETEPARILRLKNAELEELNAIEFERQRQLKLDKDAAWEQKKAEYKLCKSQEEFEALAIKRRNPRAKDWALEQWEKFQAWQSRVNQKAVSYA